MKRFLTAMFAVFAMMATAAQASPIPTNVRVVAGPGTLSVTWGVSTTENLDSFGIWWYERGPKNLEWVTTVPKTARQYLITNLKPNFHTVVVFVHESTHPEYWSAEAYGSGTPESKLEGARYYVSPSGSDLNSGTFTQPWKTVAKVNKATLKGGDTVYFEGGATFADAELEGNAGGESGKPITYASYGPGQANIKLGAWDASHNFLTFNNLEVNNGSMSNSSTGFGGRGSDVTVEHSTIQDVEAGVEVVKGDRWHIEGNTIENTGDSGILTQVGEEEEDKPSDSFIIDGNVINKTGQVELGYGEHGIYLKSRNSEVSSNTITNFKTDGISQRYGNAKILNNTISTGGIGIAFFPYEVARDPRLTSEWKLNKIEATQTGLYAPATDNGRTTKENFVIEENTLGPLVGGSKEWIAVETTGTITEKGNMFHLGRPEEVALQP